jgi:phospholipid/cholesterol/gamma-HCH transport system substrate-binding protein
MARAAARRSRRQGPAMERDAKYAAVAAFALLAIAAAVAFVWWYSGRGDRRDYVRYEVYFDGSVSGLSRGSPVRYLGVDVGRVRNLSVERDNPSRVRVITEIDSEAPVNGATEARLGLLGLTGLLYIDLQQDTARKADRPLDAGRNFPVIPSRKGDIEATVEKLPDLLGRAAAVVERLEVLLSDRNLESVSTTLANVTSASTELPGIAREAAVLATELRGTSAEVNGLARQLRGVAERSAPELEASLASVRATADKLSRTAESLDRIVVGNEATLARFAGSGVDDLQALVGDLRGASEEIRGLARDLRERPSSLVVEPRQGGLEIPP